MTLQHGSNEVGSSTFDSGSVSIPGAKSPVLLLNHASGAKRRPGPSGNFQLSTFNFQPRPLVGQATGFVAQYIVKAVIAGRKTK